MKLKTGLSAASLHSTIVYCFCRDVKWLCVAAFEGPREWARMWPRQIACRMQLAHFVSHFTGETKKPRDLCTERKVINIYVTGNLKMFISMQYNDCCKWIIKYLKLS